MVESDLKLKIVQEALCSCSSGGENSSYREETAFALRLSEDLNVGVQDKNEAEFQPKE
jgi:hypothetical protein